MNMSTHASVNMYVNMYWIIFTEIAEVLSFSLMA